MAEVVLTRIVSLMRKSKGQQGELIYLPTGKEADVRILLETSEIRGPEEVLDKNKLPYKDRCVIYSTSLSEYIQVRHSFDYVHNLIKQPVVGVIGFKTKKDE